MCREQGVFGVAAVKASAHAAHKGCNLLAHLQLRVTSGIFRRYIRDFAHALDTWNNGFLNVIVFYFEKAQHLFAMVHAEGSDAHQHPTGLYFRCRGFGQGYRFGSGDSIQYDCFHFSP